jgi:hypothetical protein
MSFLSVPWRHTKGANVQLHTLLTSALVDSEWLNSSPGSLFPWGRNTGTQLNRRYEGAPRGSGLSEKTFLTLPGFEPIIFHPRAWSLCCRLFERLNSEDKLTAEGNYCIMKNIHYPSLRNLRLYKGVPNLGAYFKVHLEGKKILCRTGHYDRVL